LVKFWTAILVFSFVVPFPRSLERTWLVIGLTIASLTILKRGADTMYYYDACAAFAILAARVVDRVVACGPMWRRVHLLALAVWVTGTLIYDDLRYARFNSPQWGVEYNRLLATTRERRLDEPILSDDAYIPIRLGRQPEWDDPFVFSVMAQKGKWDDRVLADRLQRQYYSCVVLFCSNDLLTPRLWDLLQQNYVEEGVFPAHPSSPYHLYVPRRRKPPSEAVERPSA
jgi:hypothetical protein